MDETDHDAQWEHFIHDQGRTVEKEVYDALQENAHEAEMLLAAFHASLEGVDDATHAWGVWITSLMGMIRQCMSGVPEDN